MNRLYLTLALIVAAGLVYLRYDYVSSDRERLQAERSSANCTIETERENAQVAANRALAYSIEDQNREEEYTKLRECVDNRTCGVVVRWKSCPSVPSSSADKSKTSAEIAIAEREFQSWGIDHADLIKQYEQRVKALESDLIARSDSSACQPK